jgi:hypothetical protein
MPLEDYVQYGVKWYKSNEKLWLIGGKGTRAMERKMILQCLFHYFVLISILHRFRQTTSKDIDLHCDIGTVPTWIHSSKEISLSIICLEPIEDSSCSFPDQYRRKGHTLTFCQTCASFLQVEILFFFSYFFIFFFFVKKKKKKIFIMEKAMLKV